jgi:hypothetical protein
MAPLVIYGGVTIAPWYQAFWDHEEPGVREDQLTLLLLLVLVVLGLRL